jgi:hypothetical protein
MKLESEVQSFSLHILLMQELAKTAKSATSFIDLQRHTRQGRGNEGRSTPMRMGARQGGTKQARPGQSLPVEQ